MEEGSLVWIEIPATGKGKDLKVCKRFQTNNLGHRSTHDTIGLLHIALFELELSHPT